MKFVHDVINILSMIIVIMSDPDAVDASNFALGTHFLKLWEYLVVASVHKESGTGL